MFPSHHPTREPFAVPPDERMVRYNDTIHVDRVIPVATTIHSDFLA